MYEYDLRVDDEFLATFPGAPLDQADVGLKLTLDKQQRQMTLTFAFSGTVRTDCDRCMATVDFPVADEQELVVKFSTAEDHLSEEGDLVYLHPDASEFNAAPYAYEMIVLAVPMIRTFDCRAGEPPYPCDEEMLDRIEDSVDTSDETPAKDDDDKPSPWDVLKDLK